MKQNEMKLNLYEYYNFNILTLKCINFVDMVQCDSDS